MESSTYKLWATRLYSVMHNQGFVEYTIGHGCEVEYVVPVGESKAEYIVEERSFERACHSIGMEFMRDHAIFIGEYEARRKALIDAVSILSEKAGKIDDTELCAHYERYWKVARDFQPYMMFPHYAEQELEPAIKSRYPKEFFIITGLEKPLEHMNMNKALLDSSLESVVRDYGYLSIYSMTETPFDRAYFQQIKDGLDTEKVKESFEELERNALEYKKIISAIKPEDRLECDVLHWFIFVRTDRIDAWKKHNYLLYRFAEYVAQKIDPRLGVVEGSMLARDEVMSILKRTSTLNRDELIARGKRDSVMEVFTREGVSFTHDKAELERVKNLVKPQGAAEALVKGVSASKGHVTGRVIVFLKKSDITDEDKDYILVCPHTSPQDVPYMKRAKAILTDEGGITSHAAIVSRELSVPCVVGTKNGTKILKTGDIVEVNADKGIARKVG